MLVEPTIFVVADGMGGHKAGEVASALTVRAAASAASATTDGSLDDVLAAVVEANTRSSRPPPSNVDHQGMGTTLTGLFVVRTASDRDGDSLAGDGADRRHAPRQPIIRPHQRRRLAHLPAPPRPAAPGHRRPQLRAGARQHRPHHRRRGAHPPAPQHHHPGPRHRPVGPRRRLDAADRARRPLRALLRRAVRRGPRQRDPPDPHDGRPTPQAAADELVAAANRQGGRDNISVIVVDVLEGVDPPAPDEELDIEPVWQPEPTAGRRGRSPTRRRPSRRRSRISPPSPTPRASGWSRPPAEPAVITAEVPRRRRPAEEAPPCGRFLARRCSPWPSS